MLFGVVAELWVEVVLKTGMSKGCGTVGVCQCAHLFITQTEGGSRAGHAVQFVENSHCHSKSLFCHHQGEFSSTAKRGTAGVDVGK